MQFFWATDTEITKAVFSVMMCVNTIILPILAMVWCLRTCEFVVINKSHLLTCVSDTQRADVKFSTVSPVQEIVLYDTPSTC